MPLNSQPTLSLIWTQTSKFRSFSTARATSQAVPINSFSPTMEPPTEFRCVYALKVDVYCECASLYIYAGIFPGTGVNSGFISWNASCVWDFCRVALCVQICVLWLSQYANSLEPHLVDGPAEFVAFSELLSPESEFLSSKSKGGGLASIIKKHH